MPLQQGNIVHVPAWDTQRGTYLAEYEVVAVDKGNVGLREIGLYHRENEEVTKLGGSGQTLTLPESYFDDSLEERCEAFRQDTDWFIQRIIDDAEQYESR